MGETQANMSALFLLDFEEKGQLPGKTQLGRIQVHICARAALSGFLEVGPPLLLLSLPALPCIARVRALQSLTDGTRS